MMFFMKFRVLQKMTKTDEFCEMTKFHVFVNLYMSN